MGNDADLDLDPKVSLAFVLTLRISRVEGVREALRGVEGVRIVTSRVGAPRTLWIQEGEAP